MALGLLRAGGPTVPVRGDTLLRLRGKAMVDKGTWGFWGPGGSAAFSSENSPWFAGFPELQPSVGTTRAGIDNKHSKASS